MVYSVRGQLVDIRSNFDPHIISKTAVLLRQYDPFDLRTGRLGRDTMLHESCSTIGELHT